VIAGLVVAALALFALAYVALPLRSGVTDPSEVPPRTVEEARSRKKAALGALLELDEDAAMGKIALADLQSLRAQYEMEAVLAFIELDRAETEPVTEPMETDELEAEIRALRERMQCPSCGAVRTPGEPCPRCGA
jgi:hypothetical protein